ncbi:unnamed protein product [Moneuplotes crassus]|uniref:Uncharacterized protein n=1 Tax=Euplotes crassus TaxID=5936 RepID=A0AAD1Y4C6_EUPCR|nr:unnamed protein product [Moneuplotes crassus]
MPISNKFIYSPKKRSINSTQKIHSRSVLKTPNLKPDKHLKSFASPNSRGMEEGFSSTRYGTEASKRYHSESKRNAHDEISQNCRKNLSSNFRNYKQKSSSELGKANPGSQTKIDPPFIEERLNHMYSQPLTCYDNGNGIASPYKDGAKNLRYSSPNQVSNIVFYDQTNNLSLKKSEMYVTTSQREYSSPRKKLAVTKSQTINPSKESCFFNPSTVMISKHKKYSAAKSSSKKTKIQAVQSEITAQKPPISRRKKKCKARKESRNRSSSKPKSQMGKYTGRADTIAKKRLVGFKEDDSTLSYRSYKSSHLSSATKKHHYNPSSSHSKTHRPPTHPQAALSPSKTLRFEYPSINSQKRTHHLLNQVRGWNTIDNRLSANQKKVMQKPDHFVDLFTGDKATKRLPKNPTQNSLHPSSSPPLAAQFHPNYAYSPHKEFLQSQFLRAKCLQTESPCPLLKEGNEVRVTEEKFREVWGRKGESKAQVQTMMDKALVKQMEEKRQQKDQEVVQRYQQEIRENQRMKMQICREEEEKIHMKAQQRQELRQEMERVLEMKRMQKLKQQ